MNGGSYRKTSRDSSVPAAKPGGMDETIGGPQSLPSERVSTPYAASGGEKVSINIGRSTSVRKSSVEQGHGDHTPTKSQDFPQQPEDSKGRFQRESHAPKPPRKPAYASQQPTLDANQTSYAPKGYQGLEDGSDGDSNDDDLSVVARFQGHYGSRKSKFKDGRVARW